MIKMIIMLFILPTFLLSESNLDSLKLEIEKAVGLEKIRITNALAEEFISIDVDSTLLYAKRSFDLAMLSKNDTLSAASAYLIGRVYIRKEEYENAFDYTKFSEEIFGRDKISKNYLLTLFDMGIIFHSRSEYDKALEYYQRMLQVSTIIDDKQWIAAALDGIGTIYYFKGEYDLAFSHLDSALTEYMKLKNDYKISRLLYGIGAIYITTAKYDQALDYILKSTIISEDKHQLYFLAMSTNAIGVIYEKLKNFPMAITYNKKALEIAEKINNKDLLGNILSHSGEMYLQISNIDTALSLAKKALKVHSEIKNKEGITRALILMGNVYLKSHNYEKAHENYKKAWEMIENIDLIHRKTNLAYRLGIVYAKMGKMVIAKKHLIISLQGARKIGAQDLVQDNLKALSDYYASQNNYKKAYQYLSEFTHLSDSIFTTNSHNIAAMQMRYETEKREKENDLLKSEINVQNLELEKSNLKNWLSTLSLVIVSIIGFFSYHRYNVKRKANVLLEKKIQGALQKQQEQQEIIFHQANLSSLGELSAGMAHEINQPLQGIKLSTEALELDTRDICPENSNIKENIGEIYQGVERIEKIIDHVRVFASQQKNHIDEFFKTFTVIENALSLIGKQYLKSGIIVQTKLGSRIGQVKGNPYKYEQIVFNLLSNAKDAILEKEEKIKESIKKEIKIKTYRDDSDIVLDVQDNGIGMTMEQKNSIFNPFFTTKKLGAGTGLGLSIVFGIVKEMSGKISVKSDYGVGTLIQVKIPCAMEKNTR